MILPNCRLSVLSTFNVNKAKLFSKLDVKYFSAEDIFNLQCVYQNITPS